MDIFNSYKKRFNEDNKQEILSVKDFFDLAKTDGGTYASPWKRLLTAIGEPTIVDTSMKPRDSIIFESRKIRVFDSFKDFYGMEDVVDKVVKFVENADRGLEERKQILYLLGPVGGGKSSLAEHIKLLMCQEPIYTLAYKGEILPTLESPLSLFSRDEAARLKLDKHVPINRFKDIRSAYLTMLLDNVEGDITQLEVIKVKPSQVKRLSVAKTEPGDENNQDISALVGKTALRRLRDFDQSHPFSYDYCGGLNRAHQGMLEFVEMFKAPLKVLHPLLTATQEGNYMPTEGFGAIPFEGLILAHSNEEEWTKFVAKKENEAFIDRVNMVKVPYCLRFSEEMKIYEKMVEHSDLVEPKLAPYTLETLAKIEVASRLLEPKNSDLYTKLKVYNGEQMSHKSNKALTIREYRDLDKTNVEGMDGLSTRFAFKRLSDTLGYDPEEYAANPIHLVEVMKASVKEHRPGAYAGLCGLCDSYIVPEYMDQLRSHLFEAFIGTYGDFAQRKFENYIKMADIWIQGSNYRDSETGELWDREEIDLELSKTEKPAGIPNPKDFRNEVVNFVLRAKASNKGDMPRWDSYVKFKEVLEKDISSQLDKLLPVLTDKGTTGKEDKAKYSEFLENMINLGYTKKQVALLTQYYLKNRG